MRRKVRVRPRPPLPSRLRFPSYVEEFVSGDEISALGREAAFAIAVFRAKEQRDRWEAAHPYPPTTKVGAVAPTRAGLTGPADADISADIQERRDYHFGPRLNWRDRPPPDRYVHRVRSRVGGANQRVVGKDTFST